MWIAVLLPDGYKCIRTKGTLEDFQKWVGGYIEVVPTCISGHMLLVDEEGKLRNKKANALATQISGVLGRDVILGNAVLVRLNASRDDWTGWPTKADSYSALCACLHGSYGKR